MRQMRHATSQRGDASFAICYKKSTDRVALVLFTRQRDGLECERNLFLEPDQAKSRGPFPLRALVTGACFSFISPPHVFAKRAKQNKRAHFFNHHRLFKNEAAVIGSWGPSRRATICFTRRRGNDYRHLRDWPRAPIVLIITYLPLKAPCCLF